MQSKRVGEYLVTDEVLGKGTFSSVYVGYSRKQQKLAVKVVPRQNIKQSQLRYFQREVALLRKCNYQYIVNFVDIQKSKSNFYIFLQYCQGGSLAEHIKNYKRLPQIEALRLFGQLIKGMTCMKSMNIIHRDLKPANIMLKNGNIKIIDFGLARKFFNGQLMMTYVGSPLNMAPQILKGQPYTEKVDIYSAGTILYEMLYGTIPFQSNCREGLIKKIQDGLKEEKQVEVSERVLKILKNMLQPSPSKRIDLANLLQFVRSYDKQQQLVRTQKFIHQAKQTVPYFGIFGAITLPFQQLAYNFMQNDISPLSLDLKMCSKLIQQIKC